MSELITNMGDIGMLGSLEEDNKKTFEKVKKIHEPDIANINNSARVIDPTKIMEELKSIDPELVNEFLTRNGIGVVNREVDIDLSKLSQVQTEKPENEAKKDGAERED